MHLSVPVSKVKEVGSCYLHAEYIAVVSACWVGDQVRDAFSAVGCELFEEHFCFGFGEGPHREDCVSV